MAISMQAGTVPPGVSNYEKPVAAGNGTYQFYEAQYTVSGPQEWIIMPSIGCGGISASVTLSFPTQGEAVIEATDSPASVVSGAQTKTPWSGPVVYQLCDSTSDTTHLIIQGPTAIRVNCVGSAMISVRV